MDIKDLCRINTIDVGDFLLYEYLREKSAKVNGNLINIDITDLLYSDCLENLTNFSLIESLNRLAAKNLIRMYDAEFYGENADCVVLVLPPDSYNLNEDYRLSSLIFER